jgi:hypothetical protein
MRFAWNSAPNPHVSASEIGREPAQEYQKHWAEWEMELVRQYYDAKITRDQLQEALPHRHTDVIKHKAARMGLRWTKRQPWEPNLRWEEVPEGTFYFAPNATDVMHNVDLSRPSRSTRGSHAEPAPIRAPRLSVVEESGRHGAQAGRLSRDCRRQALRRINSFRDGAIRRVTGAQSIANLWC